MLFAALRKAISYAIKCNKMLLDMYYYKLVYLGDGCIEYDYMKFKDDNDIENMFSIFWKFHSK